MPAHGRADPASLANHRRAASGALGAAMNAQTKQDFLVMAAAALVVVAVTTVTFAILMTQLN